jgi:hypothetical protein
MDDKRVFFSPVINQPQLEKVRGAKPNQIKYWALTKQNKSRHLLCG